MIRHLAKGVLLYVLLGFLIAYGPPSFATEVNHNTSDDGYTQFGLPFDFELYGVSFDTAKMYTNGVVQFGAPPPYGHYCCHGEEYTANATHGYQHYYDISYTIMPLWTDIVAWNSGSRQYTENNGTSFTFGWEDLREYNRQSTNTFALTIDDTGSWYVEYDAVNILNHNVSVGSVGDYDADEWDQFTYRTYQQNTTLSDVNGYTGYTVEQNEETALIQYTSDGICDYTAIEDPDCTTATETYEETYSASNQSGGPDDGSIIDDGQDDGSTTDTYNTTVVATYQDLADVYEDQTGSSQNQSTDDTTAPDGQDSGDTYGDTGENEEIVMEEEIYYEEPSSTVTQDGSIPDTTSEQDNQTNGEVVTAEVTGQVPVGTSTVIAGDIVSIEIDPNAALNADSAFASTQRASSFRRTVNSRAVAHLVSVGGLPTIGATSAEQYQAMTSSGTTVNGMLVNQEMANDPSRMYMPANPNNPTGIMIADASQSMNNNTFDPNQTGMYGVPNGNVDNQALQGMIVASESPMGNEIELEEALSTEDLGGLSINDFVQPKLADQSNWYSNENALAQQSIYNNQQFYKQQEIYKGVNWYGNN